MEFNSLANNMIDFGVEGALLGAFIGLTALKNKRKFMARFGAIGMGVGGGYAMWEGQKRFSEIRM
jgi:hypothetical protein